VEEHLRGCPCCAAAERSYRAVIDLARRLPPLPVPAAVLQRLRQRVEAAGVNLAEADEGQAPPSDAISLRHALGRQMGRPAGMGTWKEKRGR
jgi:hypothetical protein